MEVSVAAVIVSYNRLELLKECIAAVRSQKRPPGEIIVVDNASTDGAAEWLATQEDLTVIFQENLGSAGGFHSGFQAACDNGYEWIWSMDDDGAPDQDSLHELIEGALASGLLIAGPLVVDKLDHARLSFGLHGLKEISDVRARAIDGVYWGYCNTFNGTLIHTSVIENIGNVKKEMFIWGDEIEYLHRALQNRIPIGTIVSALHFHPSSSQRKRKSLVFGLFGKIRYDLNQVEYSCHRNHAYLMVLQKNYTQFFIYAVKLVIFYMFYDEFSLRKTFRALRYYYDGASGKYSLPALPRLKHGNQSVNIKRG